MFLRVHRLKHIKNLQRFIDFIRLNRADACQRTRLPVPQKHDRLFRLPARILTMSVAPAAIASATSSAVRVFAASTIVTC
jgi:hypothetical protein